MDMPRADGVETAVLGILLCVAPLSVPNDEKDGGLTDSRRVAELRGMSLEDLMDLEVTSVSKKRERLNGAAGVVAGISARSIYGKLTWRF